MAVEPPGSPWDEGFEGTMKSSRTLALAAVGACAALLLTDGPALAAEYNGTCEEGSGNGELCLYYNSNWAGAKADFRDKKPDLAGYTFKAPGAGAGQAVKNNAASAQNWDHTRTAVVFFNSNYQGTYDNVWTWTAVNLSNTYNDNASFKWI